MIIRDIFATDLGEYRQARAGGAFYLEPFDPQDIYNRLHYMFTKPGQRVGKEVDRVYGISNERPQSEEQAKPGKLGAVWNRCAVEVADRIARGETISRDEAMMWGV